MNYHSTQPCLMKRSSLTPESFSRSRMNATFASMKRSRITPESFSRSRMNATVASMTKPTSNNISNCSPMRVWATYRIQGKKLRCDLRKELGISSFEKEKQTKLRCDLRKELGIPSFEKKKQTIHWKRQKQQQSWIRVTSTPIEAGHVIHKGTYIPR